MRSPRRNFTTLEQEVALYKWIRSTSCDEFEQMLQDCHDSIEHLASPERVFLQQHPQVQTLLLSLAHNLQSLTKDCLDFKRGWKIHHRS